MKIACFIPIKSSSDRVKGKNFRELNGKKLYEYIILNCIESNVFDEIFVDTDSEEVANFAHEKGLKTLDRKEELASNSANGNDLLNHHYTLYPDFDIYFQAFATAPFLQSKSIQKCVEALTLSNQYDSCFTAISHNSFFWLNGVPTNYRPDILPRSQDLSPVIEETTGLYGIRNKALDKYRCRIGVSPYNYIVDKFEAIDINTEEDFMFAELIGEKYF